MLKENGRDEEVEVLTWQLAYQAYIDGLWLEFVRLLGGSVLLWKRIPDALQVSDCINKYGGHYSVGMSAVNKLVNAIARHVK